MKTAGILRLTIAGGGGPWMMDAIQNLISDEAVAKMREGLIGE